MVLEQRRQALREREQKEREDRERFARAEEEKRERQRYEQNKKINLFIPLLLWIRFMLVSVFVTRVGIFIQNFAWKQSVTIQQYLLHMLVNSLLVALMFLSWFPIIALSILIPSYCRCLTASDKNLEERRYSTHQWSKVTETADTDWGALLCLCCIRICSYRLEQERRRQQELERQLEKQRQMEKEREEQRRKALAQREV